MTCTTISKIAAILTRTGSKKSRRFKKHVRHAAILGMGACLLIPPVQANNHWPFGQRNPDQFVVVPSQFSVVTPTSYMVVLPSVTTSYVLATNVDLLPANILAPLPLYPGPCGNTGVVSPALESTRVPELKEVPQKAELEPAKPAEKKTVESSPDAEPKLDDMGVSPNSAKDNAKKESPANQPPPVVPKNTNQLPAKPPVEEEKPPVEEKLPPPVDLPPAEPAKLPDAPPKAPDNTGIPLPEAVKPAVEEPPKSPIPLPNAVPANEPTAPPALKPSKTATDTPAKPAGDNLVPPTISDIPLPQETVPPLEPVLENLKTVTPTSTNSKSPEVPKSSELPPGGPSPVDTPPAPNENTLPKLPDSGGKSVLPQIPLPEIPAPAEDLNHLPPINETKINQPVPELIDQPAGKPVVDSIIKTSGDQPNAGGPTTREAFKPVIGDTSKLDASLPKLGLTVRNQSSGAKEKGVTVLFRAPGSSQIKFRTQTDDAGSSNLEIPEGRWEVLVEMPNGPYYVLGELISEKGQVKTVSGRSLPTLEINR